jgi:hypothetical protein
MSSSEITYLTYKVTVASEWHEDDYCGSWWTLRIQISDGILNFVYEIDEPYCSTQEEWYSFIDGKKGIGFYMGNGDGSIECRDDMYVFHAAPSGGGGDVSAEITFKREPIASCLRKVIDDVVQRGWEFSSK